MMGGAVHGGGGPALATHNSAPQENDDARPGTSRSLMSEGIAEQIRELTHEAKASGHKAPLRHAWASPPPGAEWGEREWDAYWTLYEKAQDLEGCAYSEAIHDKPGEDGRPPHRHRVYLALTERGTLVRTGWDFAKQEAVSRIMEVDTGQRLNKGKHNVRAATFAREFGREDVAQAMIDGGLLAGSRAVADLSPRDRLIQERTKVEKADVARGTATAWAASEGGASLSAALRAQGLRLAWGEKKNVPVVVDRAGTAHGLAQMLRMAAREDGTKAPKADAIAVRLDCRAVPSVAEVRREIRAEGTEPAAPIMIGAATPALNAGAAAPEARQPAPIMINAAPVASEPAAPASQVKQPQPAAVPASRDGEPAPAAAPPDDALASSEQPAGGGGGVPAPEVSAGGGGAALADAGDGPGEPPRPNASPEELSRYRAKLAAYEERKASAWAAWVAVQRGQEKKGGTSPPASGGQDNVGNQQAQGRTLADTIAASIRRGLQEARARRDPAAAVAILPTAPEHGDDGGPGRERPADLRGDEGGPRHCAGGGEPAGRDGAAWPRGERPAGRGEGAAAGNLHEARDNGRQAFRHRAAVARATAALGSLNVSALLDRLEPDRVVRRVLDAEAARIATGRKRDPHPDATKRDPDAAGKAARDAAFAPMHAATGALAVALARQEVVPPVPWTARLIPWETAVQREGREAREAVATAHAAVAVATPSRDTVEDVVHLARTHAGNAATEHAAWEQAEGQGLDRAEHLLHGVRTALDAGDPAMRQAVLSGGIEEAMRVQAEREAAQQEAARQLAAQQERRASRERGNVVSLRVPGNR